MVDSCSETELKFDESSLKASSPLEIRIFKSLCCCNTVSVNSANLVVQRESNFVKMSGNLRQAAQVKCFIRNKTEEFGDSFHKRGKPTQKS